MARNESADRAAQWEEIACPLCEEPSFRLVHEVRDRLQARDSRTAGRLTDTFRIVACLTCGFRYLNPRPRDEHLAKYYRTEGYDPHRRSGGGIVGMLYRLLRPFSVGFKAAKISKGREPGRLLDVGCGSGEFLIEMQRRGWETLGIEEDETAARLAQASGCPVLIGDPLEVALPNATFDLITFWHALEHLPDIKGTIAKVTARLERGGILAIALPNPDSCDARFYGSKWAAWDAPRHLYHFRRCDLERLLQSASGQFRLIRSHALPLDPFYHALLSEISWSRGAAAILRALRGLVIGAVSFGAGFKAGSGSSTLYLFEKG